MVLAALVPALVAFAVVQDRVTAAGVYQYVTLQRANLAAGTGVTLEQVMGPAIRQSVEQGALWGTVAGAGGLACAIVVRGVVQRRRHRE